MGAAVEDNIVDRAVGCAGAEIDENQVITIIAIERDSLLGGDIIGDIESIIATGGIHTQRHLKRSTTQLENIIVVA